MATKPGSYLNWNPSGSNVQQPSSGQLSNGWVSNQKPPNQYLNWLFYYCDQWIQWFDQVTQALASASGITASTTPLATTCTTVSGSPNISALASTSGLIKGQLVSCANFPGNTFVVSVSGSTAVLSQNATASGTGVTISFEHAIATGANVQLQLDELDAALNYLSNLNSANALLNSDFYWWQRGTSFLLSYLGSPQLQYTADRWGVDNNLGSGGVITVSQVTGALNGSAYGLKAQVTTAPSTAVGVGPQIVQILDYEDSQAFYGQEASFSVNVKALGNVTSVEAFLFYATSEPVFSALTPLTVVSATVSTSGFVQLTIPAQAIGTAMGKTGLIGVYITPNAVSSGHISDLNNGLILEQAMLNVGPIPAPYKRALPSNAAELAALKRYYEKSFPYATAPANNTFGSPAEIWTAPTTGSSGAFFNIKFTNQKRSQSSPTVTLYNPQASSASPIYDLNTGSSYGATQIQVTDVACLIQPSGSGWAANDRLSVQWAADAEIY